MYRSMPKAASDVLHRYPVGTLKFSFLATLSFAGNFFTPDSSRVLSIDTQNRLQLQLSLALLLFLYWFWATRYELQVADTLSGRATLGFLLRFLSLFNSLVHQAFFSLTVFTSWLDLKKSLRDASSIAATVSRSSLSSISNQ